MKALMIEATGESRERRTGTQRKLYYVFGHAVVVTTAKNPEGLSVGEDGTGVPTANLRKGHFHQN